LNKRIRTKNLTKNLWVNSSLDLFINDELNFASQTILLLIKIVFLK
jgi:hypothetical protein